MIIIPAIDIQGGYVVRLVQGRLDKKIYSRDPIKTARHWVKQGAGLIHVVDLDGAASGSPKNLAVVKEIVKNISVPVEFGGGARNIDTIKTLLDLGVYRVVLGTRAIQDAAFLKKAYKIYGNNFIKEKGFNRFAILSFLLILSWQFCKNRRRQHEDLETN